MKKRKYSLGSLRKFTDIINSEDHYLKREGGSTESTGLSSWHHRKQTPDMDGSGVSSVTLENRHRTTQSY